jgi:hypothetical protein
MIDFKKHVIIGCIPKRAMNEAPKDQTPCILENCPICNEEMWISSLKREWRATKPNVRAYCFYCIVKEQIKQGIKENDVDLVDLAGVH